LQKTDICCFFEGGIACVRLETRWLTLSSKARSNLSLDILLYFIWLSSIFTFFSFPFLLFYFIWFDLAELFLSNVGIVAASWTNSRDISLQGWTSFSPRLADYWTWVPIIFDGHFVRRDQLLQARDCKKEKYFKQLHSDAIRYERLSRTVASLYLAPDTLYIRTFTFANNLGFRHSDRSSNQNKLFDNGFHLTQTSSMAFLFRFRYQSLWIHWIPVCSLSKWRSELRASENGESCKVVGNCSINKDNKSITSFECQCESDHNREK
jgi:hypothetical protein